MSTDTVLKNREISEALVESGIVLSTQEVVAYDIASARAIEQAVLQSPEVQALRKNAERFEFLRDNSQLFSHFGEAGNSGWCVMRRDSAIRRVFTYNGEELVEAIDAAMEKQP